MLDRLDDGEDDDEDDDEDRLELELDELRLLDPIEEELRLLEDELRDEYDGDELRDEEDP